MKTKQIPVIATPVAPEGLQLVKEGSVTLQGVTAAIARMLGEMSDHSDFRCSQFRGDLQSLFVFSSGGLCATLNIQPLSSIAPKKKGGRRCVKNRA